MDLFSFILRSFPSRQMGPSFGPFLPAPWSTNNCDQGLGLQVLCYASNSDSHKNYCWVLFLFWTGHFAVVPPQSYKVPCVVIQQYLILKDVHQPKRTCSGSFLRPFCGLQSSQTGWGVGIRASVVCVLIIAFQTPSEKRQNVKNRMNLGFHLFLIITQAEFVHSREGNTMFPLCAKQYSPA